MNSVETCMSRAKEVFPELDFENNYIDNPYTLFQELVDLLHSEYDKNTLDRNNLKRIYDFAEWSCNLPRGETAKNDVLTAVAVSFLEHVPQHPGAFKDMPNWFKKSEIIKSKELFSYHIGEEKYNELLKLYK